MYILKTRISRPNRWQTTPKLIGSELSIIRIWIKHDEEKIVEYSPLRWRHNEHDSVSNHQPHDCLFNRIFRHSGTDQGKYQSSASLAFVRGMHRWPLNSPHKGPVTRKMFPFVEVIMYEKRWSCGCASSHKYAVICWYHYDVCRWPGTKLSLSC